MKQATWKHRIVMSIVTLLGLGSVYGQAPSTVNIDEFTFTPLQVKTLKKVNTLLLSDSPEYVKEPGIVAAGTLEGHSRVYFYHVNEHEADRKIGILLENKGTKPAFVQIERTVYAKPSPDYFKVGRELSKKELETATHQLGKWEHYGVKLPVRSNTLKKEIQQDSQRIQQKEKEYKSVMKTTMGSEGKRTKVSLGLHRDSEETSFVLHPGESRPIFKKLDSVMVHKDDLFSGIVDFTTTQPLYASVAMMEPKSTVEFGLPLLPVHPIDDVELRGTYIGRDRLHIVEPRYNSDAGPGAFEIANDREDAFIPGVDETSNQKVVKNKGNYGVTNTYLIQTEGKTPYALYFNPLGGAFSGSFAITSSKGTRTYHIPNKGSYLGHETIYDTQLLDTFDKPEDLLLEYMSPGASNLPVRFLLIPQVKSNLSKDGTTSYVADLVRRILGK